jgi:alkylation response protein AidB-like acyl-CoA dehydrogenase
MAGHTWGADIDSKTREEAVSNESVEEIEALTNAFIDENWDPEITVREWWDRLAKARLVNTTLPSEAGGRGWTGAQASAVARVLSSRRVVGGPGGLGMLLAAPTIGAHGTPEQIEQWLPKILDGSEAWCQLFSEPGAGSDLASLQCRAVRDGDEWVVTGQKVWTSNGQEADWGMLLARTDPDAPKHQGITYFGMRMDQPGVEVRPLTEMTGRALFNEVFIEEARVSDADIIGGLNNGWRVANTTLMYERSGIGGGHGGGYGTAAPGTIAGHLDQPVGKFLGRRGAISVGAVGRRVLSLLSSEAEARDRADDPVVRDGLAQLHIHYRLASMTLKRQAAERRSGRKPSGMAAGVEGNLAKLLNTRTLHLARDLVGQIMGPDATLVGRDAPTEGLLQELILFSPAPPIYGGTDEVQRNVIGERGLGLPKEPGPSRDTPFKDLPK